MRVQNVDHNENRELRRDCAAVFQMLFDRKQQDFIAEGIVIAGAAGSKENGRGSLSFAAPSARSTSGVCPLTVMPIAAQLSLSRTAFIS